MSEKGFYILYFSILTSGIVAGRLRYQFLDKGGRIILLLLAVTLINEIAVASFMWADLNRTRIYHFFSPVELSLLSWYFFVTTVRGGQKFIPWLVTLYCAAAAGNILFVQSIEDLNKNYIIMESFLVITMSLYALFKILINEQIALPFCYNHFWFWSLLLLYFSVTFFFWLCIGIFYAEKSPFFAVANYLHIAANLVMYSGFALVIYLQPKHKDLER